MNSAAAHWPTLRGLILEKPSDSYATLFVSNRSHVLSVFLDSSLVSVLSIPVVKLANSIFVNTLDGRPLSDRPITQLTHPLCLDFSPRHTEHNYMF